MPDAPARRTRARVPAFSGDFPFPRPLTGLLVSFDFRRRKKGSLPPRKLRRLAAMAVQFLRLPELFVLNSYFAGIEI